MSGWLDSKDLDISYLWPPTLNLTVSVVIMTMMYSLRCGYVIEIMSSSDNHMDVFLLATLVIETAKYTE